MEHEMINCPDNFTAYGMIAETIRGKLEYDLRAHDKVVFIVSGGKTPTFILPLVSSFSLDFSRIIFIASDERVVPPACPDSTEGMIISIFRENNVEINYIGLDGCITAGTALQSWKEQLTEHTGTHVSIALLGMGEDGHFASFFPGRPEITSKEIVMSVSETPPHRHQRLTLGLSYLLRSDMIVLPALSERKKEVIQLAMTGKPYPVSFLLRQQHTPLKIFLSG
jgi:6-phosphogluconolactonase